MSRKSDVQNELVALIQALLILFVTAEAFLSGWEHRREVKESLAATDTALPAAENKPATVSAKPAAETYPTVVSAEPAVTKAELAEATGLATEKNESGAGTKTLPETGKEEA